MLLGDDVIKQKDSSSIIINDQNVLTTNEILAIAIHDLKTPLTIIRGLADLGNMSLDYNSANKYFDKIIKQTNELNDMVVGLLNTFKPEKFISKPVAPIIREILNKFEPACNDKGINLLIVNECDANVRICENLFRRSIENLILNAVQNINTGFIKLRTELENDSILISIEDTAGGIPETIDDDSIFDAFTCRRNGGTGLGLFMVYYTITAIHGGKVWFTTKIGEGTTFYLKLPIATD